MNRDDCPAMDTTRRTVRTPIPASLLFAAACCLMELWLRIGTTTDKEPFWTVGLFFMPLLTVFGAFLVCGLCLFLPQKARFWVQTGCLAFVMVLCMSQLIYARIFGYYFVMSSARGLGHAVGDFYAVFFDQLLKALVYWLLMVATFVGWILAARRFPLPDAERGLSRWSVWIAAAGVYVVFFVGLLFGGRADLSPWYLYWRAFDVNPSVRTFGVVGTLRLDVKYLIFGFSGGLDEDTPTDLEHLVDESSDSSDVVSDGSSEDDSEVSEVPPPIVYNQMDLDFDALSEQTNDRDILSLHEYFRSLTPTAQNEYTGMFRGKNVILITAEAFYTPAVDEKLTPTLYKMAHDGLEFSNYYSPGWGVSTLDGEYANLVGAIPESGVWSMWRARENNLYFTVGNVCSRLGYKTLAYHNHTYDYYSRDESHFNLGYTYKGIGNGLTLPFNGWPRSDDEMIEATVSDYLSGNEPFSVYYLTVSGHAPYSRLGSSMTARNWDAVADLPYSEEARAFLAAQIELDKAMERLLNELEAAGKLDDTLIVLAADHYPYALAEATLKEFLGKEYDTNFGIYHNTLMIYNPQFSHKVIDKPCYSVDILPTVLNLMGAEYDSRLLIGSDILSSSQGLVVFLNRSWITAYGRYNANSGVFTPAKGKSAPKGYVDAVNAIVSKKFSVSTMLLDTDYYAALFGKSPNKPPA